MKRNQPFPVIAIALVLAMPAIAQLTAPSPSAAPSTMHRGMPHPREDRLNGAAKASDVLGIAVKNDLDEILGKVTEVALDLPSGRIVQVIQSTDGPNGTAMTAVPAQAYRHDIKNKVLRLDSDKEKMKAAPLLSMSEWAGSFDSTRLSESYQYFGEPSTLKFIHKGETAVNGLIPESRLAYLQKATVIIGAPVVSPQGDRIGTVNDILLDLASGRILLVIIASGTYLGLGDVLSPVPPEMFQSIEKTESLQLDVTHEKLRNSPHFISTQWPDYALPSRTEEIYRNYRIEPYFKISADKDADNTARNANNRSALTPLDHGSSKADLDITTQIRKQIIANTGMSINAQNVKIITIEGHVTLRGPVNSIEEKQLIVKIADRIARAVNVTNQLEVIVAK